MNKLIVLLVVLLVGCMNTQEKCQSKADLQLKLNRSHHVRFAGFEHMAQTMECRKVAK